MLKIQNNIQKYAILGVFILLFVFFSIGVQNFPTSANLANIVVQSSILAVMALGLNMVMMVGEIDISFAGSVPLLACIFVLLVNGGKPSLLAFGTILLADLIISLVNVLLIVKLKLNSFITTAAMMFLLNGLWFKITKGNNIWIKEGFDRSFIYGYIGPIPIVGIILIFLFIILYLMTERSRFGMAMRAVRSDAETARSSGINVFFTKTFTFLMTGAVFALCTILIVARLSGAVATSGTDVMLPTMTIAFVGQSVLGLGRPNMWGILIGAFLLGMVNNAFTLMNMPFWSVPMAYGTILLISIALANIGQNQIKQIRL